MSTTQNQSRTLETAIKREFKKKHGHSPLLPDTLDPVRKVPVTNAQSKAAEAGSEAGATEKTLHLKARLANKTASRTGHGSGFQLKHLAASAGQSTDRAAEVDVDLTLTWTPGPGTETGHGPPLSVKENSSLKGVLKIGSEEEAATFHVAYNIGKKVLAAGWSQGGETGSDGHESVHPGLLAQIYDSDLNLALPSSFPFALKKAFLVCDIGRDLVVAELQSEIAGKTVDAYVATGPESAFSGEEAEAGSPTSHVSLFGVDLKGIELQRLPLVDKRLSSFGLKPIKASPLGIVAATTARKTVDVNAPSHKTAFKNTKFSPPEIKGVEHPEEVGEFFKDKEVKEGVSVIGKLSFGSLSDVFVIPFYRPKHTPSGRSQAPRLPEGETGTNPGDPPHPVPETSGAATGTGRSSSNSSVHWTRLQKTVGVFEVSRIGIQIQTKNGTPALALHLDVGLKVSGMEATLLGLGAEFGVEGTSSGTTEAAASDGILSDFTLLLQGIQIDFKEEGLQVEAGLEHSGDSYSGDAVMRAEEYGFSGVGSFSTGSTPSLFVFVFLDAPIGTPTIHVEQLAAGFGYNRGAESPHISSLSNYPLIETMQTGEVKLSEYRDHFPPKAGNVWLGGGVQFASWKMVDASVIPLLSVGTQPSVNVLGTADVSIPDEPAAPVRIALALEASYSFETGRLSFGGQLLPQTHIVFKEAEFKGGFGLCTWLPTPHPSRTRRDAGQEQPQVGDYVVTFGGYSPKLDVPSYYPQVPRLGADVTINEYVGLEAQLFAALTPSALMFGGTLKASLSYDAFEASFRAQLDVLMRWKPLHYDAAVKVDIDVSVTVHFLGTHTISAHVGADLHLSGPPVHGTVTIDLSVFSTTVHFGDDKSKDEGLTWAQFKSSFLPAKNGNTDVSGTRGESLARSPYCSVQVARGLAHRLPKRTQPSGAALAAGDGSTTHKGWVVHPRTLRLEVETQVPSTTVTIQAKGGSHATTHHAGQEGWNDTLAVAPSLPKGGARIEPGDLQPTLTITLHRLGDAGTDDQELVDRFTKNVHWGTKPLPKSMWGEKAKERSAGADAHVQDALASVGLEAEIRAPDETTTFPWSRLTEEDETRSFQEAAPPSTRRSLGDRLSRAQVASAFKQSKTPDPSTLDALGASGFDVASDRLSIHHLKHAAQQGFLAGPRKMTWTKSGGGA